MSTAAQLRGEAADLYREARQLWHDLDTDPAGPAPGWRHHQLADIAALTALSQAASSLAIAVDLETRIPRPIQVNPSAVPFGATEPAGIVPVRHVE